MIVDVEGDDDAAELLDQTAAALDGAGFDADVFDASGVDSTTITYGPDGADAARLLAAQLQNVPVVELDEEIAGYRVVLSVGDDFAGVRPEALPLDQLPPDLVPTTTAPTSSVAPGTDTTGAVDPAAPSTTTTSVPGVVPTDPAKAATCR